jgi:ribosomal protein S18 acetylase RimI-like enzyme
MATRLLTSADLNGVSWIEAASFGDRAWACEHVEAILGQQTCFGQVVEGLGGSIAGYVIFGWDGAQLTVLRLVVDPANRRRGYGRALLGGVAAAPGKRIKPRPDITAFLSDEDTAAHLFLRACGFKAVEVIRGRGQERDRYRFLWQAADAPKMAGVVRKGANKS